MIKTERVTELLEEERELLLSFEAVTQEMLTCQAEQLEEKMKVRQRLLEEIQKREEELEELCGAGEAGAEAAPPEEDAESLASGPEEPDPVRYPPCPWVVRFYPHASRAEVVEILLKSGWKDGIHD